MYLLYIAEEEDGSLILEVHISAHLAYFRPFIQQAQEPEKEITLQITLS